MAYLNGKRIGINAHVICDTDASYAAGREAGYAEGHTAGYTEGYADGVPMGYNQGEEAGYKEGQKSMAVIATATGETAVCDYVHPVEHEMKVQLETKNLLPYPFYHKNRTQNGITFTDNGDGTITVNGTASGVVTQVNIGGVKYNLSAEFMIQYGENPHLNEYDFAYLSGCPAGGSSTTYYLIDATTGHRDTGSGTVGLSYRPTGSLTTIKIQIIEGTVCDNLVFKPMVTRSNTAYADWTPYVTDFTGFQVIQPEGDGWFHHPNADGSIQGVRSVSPSTSFSVDPPGAIVTAEYYMDAARKLEDMGVTLMNLGGSL